MTNARLVLDAEAPIPTRHGPMRFIVFRWGPERDHVAIVRGDPAGDDTLVSMHSACMTSEVFGSLECDCALKLDRAMAALAAEGRGVIVYLRQEGRGIGHALGVADDARRYDAAAALLEALGVRSVRLLTNDPGRRGQKFQTSSVLVASLTAANRDPPAVCVSATPKAEPAA